MPISPLGQECFRRESGTNQNKTGQHGSFHKEVSGRGSTRQNVGFRFFPFHGQGMENTKLLYLVVFVSHQRGLPVLPLSPI